MECHDMNGRSSVALDLRMWPLFLFFCSSGTSADSFSHPEA